jgi:predicted nucleic acid-binding protein
MNCSPNEKKTTASMKNILFDSHAVLKWVQREKGYEKVRSLLRDCRDQSLKGYMNQVNLGEVYYLVIRRAGLPEARIFLENFQRLPLETILPDGELIWQAAEIKAHHPISYADCFAAATAMRFQAAILTGDPEFKKLGHLVAVEWL